MVQKIKPKAEKDAEKQDEKALLAPDEFLSTTGHAFDWIQHHSQQVLVAIVVVFAGAALAGGFTYFQGSRNADSSLLLSRALKPYHRPVSTAAAAENTPEDEKPYATAKEKWTASRDALRPVAEKEAGSGAGRLALLYLADSHSHLGEYAEAIANYEKFLRDAPASDPVRFLALQGLGAAQESKGDLKAAAKTFQELTTLPGKQGKDYGFYHGGRVLLASGDKAEAKKLLEKLTKEKDYEGSPLKPKAEELLGSAQ